MDIRTNSGKMMPRSKGVQRSLIDPPAQVNGVDPNKPAMKRNASCAPMLGASAEAMMKII